MINKFWFLFLCPIFCLSQTLTGTVTDATTNKPLETVTIYFDNTTIGTTTDADGIFSISYSDAIQSTLVISYLGYEKVIIKDYRIKRNINVKLKPTSIGLDEVVIDFDDGLTRKQKLRLFRKEFLGMSKHGKSCKILNENDLVLRYDKVSKTLHASSDIPIVINNKSLQYKIEFDIIDFEVNYRYVDIENQDFVLNRIAYAGTSYYKDLGKVDKKRIRKRREKVYRGSVQHFMRSLYNQNLKQEGYWIFHKGFRVDEWSYFKIKTATDPSFKEVRLEKKVSILYNKKEQSDIEMYADSVLLDAYGNHSEVRSVYFTGVMGSQRIGDTLPMDYGL